MDLMKMQQTTAVQIPDDLKQHFSLAKNLETVIPRLPQVKILHGAEMFGSAGKKVESFEGVIIDHVPSNAWWAQSLKESGGNKMPDCYSTDGIAPPQDLATRQSDKCATCKHMQQGSDPNRDDGKGTACKQMRRIHLITQGSLLPRRLTITIASFANFSEYMTNLFDQGYPYPTVVTKFYLQPGTQSQYEYSVANFELVRPVSVEEMYVVADYIKRFNEQARAQEVAAEEYEKSQNGGDTSFNTEEFENEQPESDIPY